MYLEVAEYNAVCVAFHCANGVCGGDIQSRVLVCRLAWVQQQQSTQHLPSSVSPLAADEYSPADSVEMTVPPSFDMADSKESRVRVEGS
jgi:hypothetical protein